MFVLVAPGGIVGWDWLWLGIALFGDIANQRPRLLTG